MVGQLFKLLKSHVFVAVNIKLGPHDVRFQFFGNGFLVLIGQQNRRLKHFPFSFQVVEQEVFVGGFAPDSLAKRLLVAS